MSYILNSLILYCSYICLSSVSFLCFTLLLWCLFRSYEPDWDAHAHTHTHTHTISLISFNVSTPKSLEASSGRINYPGSHYTLNQGYQHVTRCFQKLSLPLSFKSPPLSFPLPIVYLDKGQNLNGKCLDLSLCYKRQGWETHIKKGGYRAGSERPEQLQLRMQMIHEEWN